MFSKLVSAIFEKLPWEWWIKRAWFARSEGLSDTYVLVRLNDDLSGRTLSPISLIARRALRDESTPAEPQLYLEHSYRVCGCQRSDNPIPFWLGANVVRNFLSFPRAAQGQVPAEPVRPGEMLPPLAETKAVAV